MKGKKVYVVGAGFIASHLDYEVITERIPASKECIRVILDKYKPDTIICCIGFCGYKNIDDCEINKTKTLECNLTIPVLLATECHKKNIQFVNIGSGCIFYGPSPNIDDGIDLGWKEIDDPKLESASSYSKSKYASDLALSNLDNTSILRIRMPVSFLNSPRNLINKLLNYTDIIETPNSITIISDLVRAINWVIQDEKFGIWHITNPEPLTHGRLLEEYQKYRSFSFNKITEEQLGHITKASRSNCFLNTDKLKAAGFEMTPTIEALEKTMKEFVKVKYG